MTPSLARQYRLRCNPTGSKAFGTECLPSGGRCPFVLARQRTSNSATLTWTASTDSGGSGLAGYDVYREQGTTDQLLGQSTTNSLALTGLSPSTQYQVYVRARDGAGNVSWNATLTVSGRTVTAKNLGYNGTLAPDASTTFGFQVSRPSGNTQTPSGYTCA
ncbi:fibronectin type III domain-containing protein [Nonomuraea sp. CA-141351]|uniref:fibronectin type III domain-containing protein n=1 Tax=Nonomuraea sp. CA-141351 TaxID=3239996 RepID=UPI003D944807